MPSCHPSFVIPTSISNPCACRHLGHGRYSTRPQSDDSRASSQLPAREGSAVRTSCPDELLTIADERHHFQTRVRVSERVTPLEAAGTVEPALDAAITPSPSFLAPA